MLSFPDQLGRTVNCNEDPQRIVSLVPSQTELLYYLGLEKEVAGITKFCVHPQEWFRSKARIGGTKNVHIELVHKLNPDLIIANKEENVKEQVEILSRHYPVWISDVNNLEDAYEMILAIGVITNKKSIAENLVAEIKAGFINLQSQALVTNPRIAYLIWKDPYMTVGGDTFINAMIGAAGFINVFEDRKRYPEVTLDELRTLDCDVILLSSEPFPFKQQHINELGVDLPHAKIFLADGEIFSWYGSRLLHAPAYFQKLQKIINQTLYI